MADARQQFPEISAYLDDSPEYELSSSEFKRGDNRYLLVTQKGPQDGQQILFVWNDERGAFEFRDNDTFLDVSSDAPSIADANLEAIAAGTCGASPAADHDTVHQLTKSLVGVFDSSSGPDNGNLACVWVVRHVIKRRWTAGSREPTAPPYSTPSYVRASASRCRQTTCVPAESSFLRPSQFQARTGATSATSAFWVQVPAMPG